MLNKTSLKFIGGFVGILAISGIVWLTVGYFSPEAQQERQALEYFADLEEQYQNDTFGGRTPEETLGLFIQALEDEDIELASKYFLPEDREEMSEFLQVEFAVDGNFDQVIAGLERLERTIGKHNQEEDAFFILTDESNVVTNQVVLNKNQNGVWKITDM